MASFTIEFDIPTVNPERVRAAAGRRLSALMHRDILYNIRTTLSGAVRMIHANGRRDLPNYPYDINWNNQSAFHWNLQIRNRQHPVRSEVELRMPRLDINVDINDESDWESVSTNVSSEVSVNEDPFGDRKDKLWRKCLNLLKDPATYYWIVAFGAVVYCNLKKK